MARKIFLVGFMGCGKSSFGRRLATLVGMDFVDTDSEIVRRAGMSVPEIFATKGEAFFRETERQVISELTDLQQDTVIALGGGAYVNDTANRTLNASGDTVYIKMSPERLLSRLSPSARAKRPKIAGMDDKTLLEYIRKTLPEREIYYNRANFVLNCEAVPDEKVVTKLQKLLSTQTK